MKIDADYIIVGSGLTGATLARLLVDAGREVLIVERRNHVGGNVHDYTHPSGIRIHTYGPHYFRTNSEKIWEFVNRFDSFYDYQAILKSYVDGEYENWPIAASYIRRRVGENWAPEFTGMPKNFEEASLAMMPRFIYEKFVKGYTEKQWGVRADSLSADLAKRFDVREDDEPRLMRHKYQGIPQNGYSEFMRTMITGIPIILNCEYLKNKEDLQARKMTVFTGPIDEYFDFDLGRLLYRGQVRENTYLHDVDFVQPCAQVNNPDPANGPHIRSIEWKHIMPPEFARRIEGTVVTKEITVSPADPNHYEYPFPDEKNGRLYEAYRVKADRVPKLLLCGRLGEYRYYDMDQAIGRALKLAESLMDQQ